ncbi:MAG: signal peptidase II [Eggerthellaceae bacterium]|nr:signal peptidase II [Eggerthellaceae bacterium]
MKNFFKNKARDFIVFASIFAVWMAIDRVLKAVFNEYDLGSVIGGPYLGIFRLRLVHNTGGAWGILGDSTTALGIFSVLVCLILIWYLFFYSKDNSFLEALGISMVVAGGISNVIDRFVLGYVVDYIEFSFFEFPVFNFADIGVTVGFAVFIIGILVSFAKEKKKAASDNA